MEISFATDTATMEEIFLHLTRCDEAFHPPLSHRVDLGVYSEKLWLHAKKMEAWDNDCLVGLVGVYVNRPPDGAFVSNVSVLPAFQGRGIARGLIERAIDLADQFNCQRIYLEVNKDNARAVALYFELGFESLSEDTNDVLTMSKILR